MNEKNSGLTASGTAQPEIWPGDIWQDRNGGNITIITGEFNRGRFIREGNEYPGICTPARRRRLFPAVGEMRVSVAREKDNHVENIEKRKAIIRHAGGAEK